MSTRDAMDHAVSNVAATVVGAIRTLPLFAAGINTVYEESLDYEVALKKWRSENNNKEFPNTYPLFIYRRSQLYHVEHGVARRFVTKNVLRPQSGQYHTYQGLHGEIDIEFMLICPTTQALESFEVAYMSEAGQERQKQFSYEIPSLGRLTFYLSYSDLDRKDFSREQRHYKGLSGSMTARGFYFVATGQTPWISEVRARVRALSEPLPESQVYSTIIITPEG